MILLHQAPSPWPGGYSSSEVSGWAPGEEREVSVAEAARLLEQFPGVFVPAPARVAVAVPQPRAKPRRDGS